MTSCQIILIHRAFVSVYAIPPFERGAQTQACLPEPTEVMTPLSRLPLAGRSQEPTPPHPSWDEDSDIQCLGLCDWYTGSQQPLWFDMVDMVESGQDHDSVSGRRLQVESYCVGMGSADAAESQKGADRSLSMHGVSLLFEPESIRNQNLSRYVPAPHRASNGGQVRLWSSYDAIYCHVALPETRDSGERQLASSGVFCLTRTPYRWWTHYGFCPFVGRLCYLLPREEWKMEEGELPVKVVDYVGGDHGALSRQRSTKWRAVRKALSLFNQ